MKRLLLVSNKVMHYRVPVYNYFFQRFKEYNWEFIVRGDELQKEDPHEVEFDFEEIELKFLRFKREIEKIDPDVVILFLHLRDLIIWPLVFWLRFKKIPVAFWTKGANLDDPENKLRYHIFNFMHSKCDGIILYSEYELKYIKGRNRHKVWVANNTINFETFPEIMDSKKQIKEEFGIPFKKVVLSVGSMGVGGGRKKLNHLVEIFNNIEMEGTGLVIVGSGVSNDMVKRMNKSNTIYLGEIHDPDDVQISKLFKMADIFSIPGHIGLGLNQAFYWGLPVVTEDGFQPPEIHYLVNGRNGFIVPENDLSQLREKIMYLLENDDTREEFSRNARNDILRNASTSNMFMGFKNCVDSLVTLKS